MALKKTDFDFIDKYLLGRLSHAEKQTFEERKEDPDFQQELRFRAASLPVFRKQGRAALKNRLQGLAKAMEAEEVEKSTIDKNRLQISSKQWWSIAAGIALLLSIFWIWNNQKPTAQDLFAQYYEPYPNIIAPLTKSVGIISTYEQAFQNYEQRNFEEAALQFQDFTSDEASQFYLALTYIGSDQLAKAIPLLQTIGLQPQARFKEASQWYLALAYLKTDQVEKSKELLLMIGQHKGHPFYDRSLELYRNL